MTTLEIRIAAVQAQAEGVKPFRLCSRAVMVAALPRRLEQFDRVSVGIFHLNLLSGGTLLHLVPKVEPGLTWANAGSVL